MSSNAVFRRENSLVRLQNASEEEEEVAPIWLLPAAAGLRISTRHLAQWPTRYESFYLEHTGGRIDAEFSARFIAIGSASAFALLYLPFAAACSHIYTIAAISF